MPAAELLMIGYGARQHLHQEITITRRAGSFTLEESLATLVQRGTLTAEIARTRTPHVEEFDRLLRNTGLSRAVIGIPPDASLR